MERSITYHIWPRDMDFAAKLHTLADFAAKRGMKLTYPPDDHYVVTFNGYEKASTSSFEEFLSAIKTRPKFSSFWISMDYRKTSKESMNIQLSFNPQHFEVCVDASNDDTGLAAHSFIKESLGLSNPPLPEPESSRPQNLHATIFLGKHFDEAAAKPAALLKRFLSLLRFDVIEAEAYRATPIPDKVKHLIERQDIYVGLVSGVREHDWIAAEAAYALGRRKHIILVIEEGAQFNPTLHGRDLETIMFPAANVEKSFISLLEEFRSLGILGI